MIKGYFDQSGNPVVDCRITIPKLGLGGQPLTMLISTGSRASTLHPIDAERIGIRPDDIHTGGYYTKPFEATMKFQQEDSDLPVLCHLERMTVRESQQHHPKGMSVLGMDVLRNMNLRYEARSGILQFSKAEQPRFSKE